MKIPKLKKIKFERKTLIAIIIALALVFFSSYIYARKFSMIPDVSLNFVPDVKEITKDDKVLVFTPHPDDETLAAGGLIKKSTEVGAKVKIVLITDGNRRGYGRERMPEFVKATGDLGVDSTSLQYLNLPEFYLKNRISQSDLTAKFKQIIDEFQPTVIVYSSKYDTNPDHKFIAETLNQMYKNDDSITRLSYLVHYKYFPNPVGFYPERSLTFPVSLANFTNNWQKLNLTKAEVDTKSTAVLNYKSQLRTPILHNLMVSMVRKNEIFIKNEK